MESLELKYRATTYRVEIRGGHIDIRIGEKHPRIDALLSAHISTQWAFITAWNPGSNLTSREQNAAAQAKLRQILQDAGFSFYEGSGIPDGADWEPERSVWIPGIGRDEAVELGRRFGQKAIVVGRSGAVAELMEC